MAVILNGITGGFSGTVGNVIGASWRGIDYMRSRATSISQPNTEAQLAQRAKFSLMGKFLRPLIPFLRTGFRSLAIKQSGFNAAMAYNLKNAVSGAYPSFAIDYEKALVSRGTLNGALNPQATPGVAGRVDFTWEDNSSDTNILATDKVVLLVYNPLRNQAISRIGGASRATEADVLQLPTLFSGETVECYIAFTDANGSVISDSQWVASVVVV